MVEWENGINECRLQKAIEFLVLLLYNKAEYYSIVKHMLHNYSPNIFVKMRLELRYILELRCKYLLNENYVVERLLYLCEKQGISRYRLAQLSGISQSSISNLIQRRSVPNILTLDKLCQGLGITLSQFFAQEEDAVELTEEQNNLLKLWMELSEIDKKLVMAYMSGLRHT